MERRTFLAMVSGGFLATPLAVEAQQAGKTARIGVLSLAAGPNASMDISQGLRELGWIVGLNMAVEYRWAAGREDHLPALAAELVRLKVDVFVTLSTPAAQAARQATTTIPIVVTFVADPVGSGLVASLARPGGNITGVSTLAAGLAAKRLELLKGVVSGVKRMAALWEPGVFGEGTVRSMREETEVAARVLGVQMQFIEARRPDDVDRAFSVMREARIGAILVFPGPMLFEARKQIVAHAAKSRLPAVYPWREPPEAGGLVSYATNFPDMYRRAATYVDKILKGAKPADLPIEQPTRFELVINLKTAKALGLTIPRSLLLQADQVIMATYVGPHAVAFGIGLFVLGLIRIVTHSDLTGYRFGGVALAIVLLVPRTGPAWQIAFHRFVEVSIGIGVALMFSVVWPEREAGTG